MRGFKLFDEELNCTACHSGSSFTNNSLQNNGIYAKYEDPGRYNITADSNDIGKFKVPTLRNIAITKPYMHDGEMETLKEVVEHYKTGGKQHFNQSQHIQPFTLTNQEQTDLIYFLNALTDKQFLD
ncbi:cytochrome-c peroxidase [Brumimicrobium salinarum]|uniref:cytochrome-c peroxidase n=1 Tax=Brumimicrobium salinarum TaxID=2058658 RepID=UPI0021CDBFA7|nr:c-type cytochrome [Brumimicrobium salinarum]